MNNRHMEYTPSNTGYTSLRDLIFNNISHLDISFFTFGATGFDDLPRNDWMFSIEYHANAGGTYVIAYRILSNNDIFVRGLNFQMDWLDDWTQISFL